MNNNNHNKMKIKIINLIILNHKMFI